MNFKVLVVTDLETLARMLGCLGVARGHKTVLAEVGKGVVVGDLMCLTLGYKTREEN